MGVVLEVVVIRGGEVGDGGGGCGRNGGGGGGRGGGGGDDFRAALALACSRAVLFLKINDASCFDASVVVWKLVACSCCI